ncbi:hypothetical protein [Nocardioides montaniterrae]
MIALHLGHLPWWGQVLVITLAVGPFLLLGVAIWIRARQDARAAAASGESPEVEEVAQRLSRDPSDD